MGINAEERNAAASCPNDAIVSPDAPPPCKPDIFKNGEVVAVFDAGMIAMEGLVNEANRRGPEMDWHYVGGRAVVRTLGNVDEAKVALYNAIPRLLT